MSQSDIFNKDYFETSCGIPYERNAHWLNFFGGIAEKIVSTVQPGAVLDAGCAMGFLVEALRNRDVAAFGVDISSYAIEQVHDSIRPFCRVASVLEPFPQRYDLIVCIEVLEHLEKADSEKAVVNLCAHTDDILFSSSPDDHDESTHFNIQPPEYWADLFARQGFYRDLDYDAGFITPWAVRFRRRSEPAHRIVREYERAYWQLLKENKSLRKSYHETMQQTHDLRKAQDDIREQFETLKEQSAFWSEKQQDLEDTVEQQAVKMEKLQAAFAEIEAENNALTAQLSAEQNQKAALYKDYLAIEAASNVQTNDLKSLQETLAETAQKIAQLEQQEAATREEITRIYTSRAWKLMTAFRKLRLTLRPRGPGGKESGH